MATHSSILAWRIPRTEEPGRLQSVGSPRVGHNRSDLAGIYLSDPWAVTGLSTVYREPLGARPHVDGSKQGKVAGPVFGVRFQASARPGCEDVSWDPTLLRQQRRRSHQHRRAGGGVLTVTDRAPPCLGSFHASGS